MGARRRWWDTRSWAGLLALLATACSDSHSPSDRDPSAAGSASEADDWRSQGAEGPSASGSPRKPVFILFNLQPDARCQVSAEAGRFLPAGLYDLAQHTTACRQPYRLNLQVMRSNGAGATKQEMAGALQLHTAEIRLTDLRGTTLRVPSPLANPFLTGVNGVLEPAFGSEQSSTVATVDVIPRAYAPALTPFVGKQIVAQVTLGATTVDDVDVEAQPFVYPIELCDGCLSKCRAELERNGITGDDLAGECQDNAGADGRLCIDDEC